MLSDQLYNLKDLAYKIAEESHQGQKYGNHDYFTYHVLGVEGIVIHQHDFVNGDSYELMFKRIIALLHDVVEDTCVTLQDLRDNGFPENVIEAVKILTKTEGYNVYDYLEKIRFNPLAKSVKIADAYFNLGESLKSQRKQGIVKYTSYLRIITE